MEDSFDRSEEQDRAHEDDHLLEDLAQTQQERDAEREVIDASAGSFEPGEAEELYGVHAEERKELGFDLAWWAEEGEHGSPQIDIATDLANQACGRTNWMRDLERHGFDPKAMTGYIGLDSVSAALVVTGLQLLGTLHSHLRGEITEVLKQLWAAMPEMTDEISEMYSDAEAKAYEEHLGAMGIELVTPEDVAEAEQRRIDSQNN